MTITRRDFGKMVGGGVAVGTLGMTTMGLSCSSVFTDIATYVPVGLQAFEAVVDIIDPAAVIVLNPIITIVKASFADLTSAISAYNNAPAASKATLLGKISTAINDVTASLQRFWNDANLPDGTLATTISSVLQIILSTLTAFLPSLPPAAAPANAPKTLAKTMSITPVKRTQKQFKADVNAALTKGGYAAKVY
jgi:hypothetical protein